MQSLSTSSTDSHIKKQIATLKINNKKLLPHWCKQLIMFPIQNICNKLNIECFNPLWQMDQEELLREIVKLNFKVKIVKVAADGFDEKWIGRIIDEKAIEDLLRLREKYGIAINGEGGEYESEIVNFPDDINN